MIQAGHNTVRRLEPPTPAPLIRCPPCRGFTPKLAQLYTTLKLTRGDVEFIFVSSDRVNPPPFLSNYAAILASGFYCRMHVLLSLFKTKLIRVLPRKDEAAFNEYFGEMPWLALPFGKRKEKESLSSLFGVEGIPTLVTLDPALNVVSKVRPKPPRSACSDLCCFFGGSF